ncbi:Transcriptional regulator of ribosomal biogenesis proteins, partial [Ascosphaera pollenicola]
MQNPSAPINISSSRSRHSPVSPGQSTLTSALQRASIEGQHGTAAQNTPSDGRSPFGHFNPQVGGSAMSFGLKTAGTGRKDSLSALAGMQWGAGLGSKPISMVGGSSANMRKESLAGSLMGGISWGAISVGSWIKEDIAMTGTSPSFHSSSYLPKLEANFMRDFSCCSFTLPTLHDLLQHYEEAHAQKAPPTPHAPNQSRADSHLPSRAGSQTPRSIPVTSMNRGMSATPGLLSPRPRDMHPAGNPLNRGAGPGAGVMSTVDDEDMDMEMDDPLNDAPPPPAAPPANISRFGQPQQQQQQHHGQQQQSNVGLTSLNLSMLHGQNNNIHHNNLQHLRSQPGTPGAGQAPTRNNPTVSSVNTPMLVSQTSSQFRGTPDSSTPGTPGPDADGGMLGTPDVSSPLPVGAGAGAGNAFGGFNMQNTGSNGMAHGLPMNSDMVDLCIDEPAKRLFSPAQFNQPTQLPEMQMNQSMSGAPGTPDGSVTPGNTSSNSQTNVLFRLGTSQYGPNSEIAQRIREQQLLAGVPDTTLGLLNEEPKPFRCPVIGCEKAYKNQNGLKYHKAHGHNNQQLHDNADGTFSIVNPETCAPYPGTL